MRLKTFRQEIEMISKTDLSEIYEPSLFTTCSGSFSLVERDKGATMKGASFVLDGAQFIVCTESIWSQSMNLYVKESQDFKFKKRCDGFVICNHQDKHFLIWIELKSGFNQVFNEAIYQIASCYVKMKSYLRNLSAYHLEDFIELGIVVSHPDSYVSKSILENQQIYVRHQQLVNQNESATDKCRRRYRNTNKIELTGNDFGADKLHLADEIMLHKLPVISVQSNEENPTFDLLPIISEVLT